MSSSLNFDLETFAAIGGTQDDLDALMAQVAGRRWFDLATPDPDFSGFIARPEDQLPGRSTEGRIEIAKFFDFLTLLVTEEQQKGAVNGTRIFDEFKRTNAPVLGPNVGQYLYENQSLIPEELQGKVALVFWGNVYRDSYGDRRVRFLYWNWNGKRWVWGCFWVGSGPWHADNRAVVLASS